MPETMKELAKLGWEWSGPTLVTIERRHMIAAMERYLQGEISSHDLHTWAGHLEGRDDVGFDEPDGDLLREFFFRLANPETDAPLSKELVGAMKTVLEEQQA